MKTRQSLLLAGILPILLISCMEDSSILPENELNKKIISLSAEINQVAVTRVNDNGFCNGDVMGVYIVDYNGENPGALLSKGNRADNLRHTYDEANSKWNSSYDVYWKDDNTNIDIYGYYPFGSPEDVDNYPFTIQQDQNKAANGENLGGYEASDFLWGKVEKVAPTSNRIRLPLHHKLSSAKVELVEGEGFSSGEWNSIAKSIVIKNVKHEATISLANGTVTPKGAIASTGIIPHRNGSAFRAIIVPQTVPANTELFGITVDSKPYSFKKGEDFTYTSGRLHKFTIKVDKKNNTGDYTFTLISEAVIAWENDEVSHDAKMKEYIVINSEAGKLRDSIIANGKDFRKVKNLKITGRINDEDFYFMRDSMDHLSALNLKEVKICAGSQGESNWHGGIPNIEDQIPTGAFCNPTTGGKSSLTRVILPDKLTSIGSIAFRECRNLSGSLIIPEGVIEIQQGAFTGCKSLDGTLSLPSTLKYIGTVGTDNISDMEDNDYFLGVFNDCNFTCELVIPNNVEVIRGYAFNNCSGLYGELHLPDGLKKLGTNSFALCKNLTGSLTIPQNIKIIPDGCFEECNFNGNLQLHDGITSIGSRAFKLNPLKGELALPKELEILSDQVFSGCDFSGVLKLPDGLQRIGANAFENNWRLMGVLEIPEQVTGIGERAFANCRGLEGIVFPEGLESIRDGAFSGCFDIGSIVSKSQIPPHIMGNAFEGVPKDNFTLEVPESAITLYSTEAGWMDFKRISAHRELVCRPSTANAINTEAKRTLVLNAEGEWYVESMPEWCSLSQTSGDKKTELTLTIKEMAKGSQPRTGEIVFKLKDKDYTHKCTVSQYDYQYAEDEVITLQKATKGNTGGINLVFLGDGYDGKDISDGKYLAHMQEQVENFFGIEPYKTYRDYFNVYTAIALSNESGIGTVNSIKYVKFNTSFTGGVGLNGDYDYIFEYVLNMKTSVTAANINETLIVITPNSTDYGGICHMWYAGAAIAYCPMSTYGYPLDTRGVLQHEAGGHGFGKLGDEYIYHNEFIDMCSCGCCPHVEDFNYNKDLGWLDNLSLSGKMHEVPWSHLIFDDRYSDIVDIYEGGYMHSRGVFRSEQNSCMNNNIPYYSTISRESIVKRIKRYAGEEYSFEEFVMNDSREAGVTVKSLSNPTQVQNTRVKQYAPVIHKESPIK